MAPSTTPTLTTDRLILRAWRPEDLEPFAIMNADPVVMEYFPATLSQEESDALVARIQACFASDGFGPWAVERRGAGEFIGFVGLAPVDFQAAFTPAVEVGWRLAAAHWGQGYASEAARESLRFGFAELGLDEIVSFTTTSNHRSRATMARIGMCRDQEGDFVHPKVAADSPLRPHVLYRITGQQWRAAGRPLN